MLRGVAGAARECARLVWTALGMDGAGRLLRVLGGCLGGLVSPRLLKVLGWCLGGLVLGGVGWCWAVFRYTGRASGGVWLRRTAPGGIGRCRVAPGGIGRCRAALGVQWTGLCRWLVVIFLVWILVLMEVMA